MADDFVMNDQSSKAPMKSSGGGGGAVKSPFEVRFKPASIRDYLGIGALGSIIFCGWHGAIGAGAGKVVNKVFDRPNATKIGLCLGLSYGFLKTIGVLCRLYTTESEGKLKYEMEANKVNLDFVSVLFSSIKDTDVKISDAEITEYMKKISR